MSCVNEIQIREDRDLSYDEAEIEDLINKVEHMKKERSILWLREFKDWMDIPSDKSVEISKEGRAALHHQKENYIRNKTNQEQHGEVSRYASSSVLASGDDSSMNILESDSSFVDMSASFHRQQYFDYRGLLGNTSGASHSDSGGVDVEHLKPLSLEGISSSLSQSKRSHFDTIAIQGSNRMAGNVILSSLTTIRDISGSQSSSACPTSPPHFQEDLLHRRQHLVEEILQLSADSFSMASSDSKSSCSEVDYNEFEPSMPEVDNFPCKNYVNGNVDGHISLNQIRDKVYNPRQGIPHAVENGICLFSSTSDQTSQHGSIDFAASADNGEKAFSVSQDAALSEKRKIKRKAKKRVISILEENPDCNACDHEQERSSQGEISANSKGELDVDDFSEFSGGNCSTQENDDFIVTYFNMSIADSETSEICSHCMRCNCVLQRGTTYRER